MTLFVERFDDGFVAVVEEQHNVRKFDGSVLAYGKTGRYAVGDDPFRRAYGRFRRMDVGILFQIHGSDYAKPRVAVGGLSAHEHEAVFQRAENPAVKIALHSCVYLLYSLLRVAVFEIHFGKNEPERAGRVAHELVEFLPIIPLRGELVAGHDREFLRLRDVGQQYIERFYCLHPYNLPWCFLSSFA